MIVSNADGNGKSIKNVIDKSFIRLMGFIMCEGKIIMSHNMTLLSESNIAFLRGDKTPRQTADFLKNGAKFRSFAYLLSQFYPEDPKEKLTEGLAEITGEGKDAVARKIRNWMNGKNLPKNRETLFQICFILKLTEQESSKVLGMISDTGIHYRNPKELAYAYALRMERTYQEAVELKEKAAAIYQEILSSDCEGGRQREISFGYTRQLQEEFCRVTTDEEFFEFIKEYGRDLGVLHETAYQKFVELLDILQNPKSKGGEADEAEESFTLQQIMQTYLRMHVPTLRRQGENSQKYGTSKDYSTIQKLVKKYWPNEGELVRMRSRKEDVSRKALLLLYLATEEFDMEYAQEDYFFEDLEEDADTMLEIRWKKMDLFLDTYGMNHLDPGNPFDFLMLYALRAQGDEDVLKRMEQMTELLFD